MDQADIPAGVDTGRPTPARIYDYMLQGNNYFQVDRFAAEHILAVAPEIRDAAWSNRGFHQRATKWIAQLGVRQFIDIGSGLPTVGNTHDVVQKVDPAARVLYVDNDPMVQLHSRALTRQRGDDRRDLRRPARARHDPGSSRAPQAHRLRRAGRPADDRGHDVRLRRIRPLGPGVALRRRARVRQLPVAVAPHRRLQAADRVPRASAPSSIPPPSTCTSGPRPRSSGSSTGWNCSRRTRAPSPASRSPACGGPRTSSSPTATARAGSTAGWPGSRDRQQTHGLRARHRPGGPGLAAFRPGRRRDRGRVRPQPRTAAPAEWVLLRVAGDPDQRVLVFDRHEWECFLDGARNGEFDDAASPGPSSGDHY